MALIKRAEFKAIPLDATADSDPRARLVLALRRGKVSGAKGLDEKITPIYRVRPEYPIALKSSGAPGHAEIEFIVDREGRARLPRVVTALQPEFGYAAANALAQWVFKGLHRGGVPVDVKVKMPIDFAAPASLGGSYVAAGLRACPCFGFGGFQIPTCSRTGYGAVRLLTHAATKISTPAGTEPAATTGAFERPKSGAWSL